MKKKQIMILCFLAFFAKESTAQIEDIPAKRTVFFKYDANGNRTKKWIDFIDCNGDNAGKTSWESELAKDNLQSIGLKLFPNPATDRVNLSVNTKILVRECKIMLTDMSGKVLYQKDNIANYTLETIPLNMIQSGVYLVKLTFNDKVYTWELVKSND
ncbi:MAG: T9SS type A sorting domain-containing protein [Chitinophagales bacterium]|nr:T9SS type A sorting domain-containing protein [Chitinophagales bacterium]